MRLYINYYYDKKSLLTIINFEQFGDISFNLDIENPCIQCDIIQYMILVIKNNDINIKKFY